VSEVTFEGNVSFASAELKKLTRVGPRGWLSRKPTFNILVMNRDVTYIRGFYQDQGFLGCRVETATEAVGEDALVVHFTIDEGDRTSLSGLEFQGNTFFPDQELETRISDIRGVRLREGAPLNASSIQAGGQLILRRYRNNGFYFARVQPGTGERDSTSGLAPVIYRIDEGPQVTVTGVRVEGNRLTKRDVIVRELTLKAGDLLQEDDRIESQRHLFATGVFRSASVTVGEVTADSTGAILLVTVNEMPVRYVGTGTGLAGDQQEQFDLRFHSSAVWGHRNLWGTARALELNAGADFRIDFRRFRDSELIQRELSLRYLEPWIFRSRIPLTTLLYIRPRSYPEYDTEEYGAEIGVAREFTRQAKAWLNLAFRQVRIDSAAVQQALVPQERSSLSGINATFERDTRDNFLSPLRGSLTRVRLNSYLRFQAQNPAYTSVLFEWSRYQLTGSRTVVAIRGRLGLAWPQGRTTEVPIFDRFFLGGASSVRGHQERSLGPESDDGNPIGGESMALFNLEIRRPKQIGPLGLLLFADAGNVWRDMAAMQRRFKLAYGTGIGIFLETPIGPFRIDHGWEVKVSSRGDVTFERGVFHFSVMYAF
ncbi:outer membrane protein assembly factor, partial [Gemmatimonadota bacterium]